MSKAKIEQIKGGFRARQMPLSADYRPLYKIAHVLLILSIASSGGKSSLNKLHFLINALKSSANRLFVQTAFELDDRSAFVSWGVEPALNRALMFAIAEGFITMKDDKYSLTEFGKTFSKQLIKDKEMFVEEKAFLEFVGKKRVTEGFITELTKQISN